MLDRRPVVLGARRGPSVIVKHRRDLTFAHPPGVASQGSLDVQVQCARRLSGANECSIGSAFMCTGQLWSTDGAT